MKTIITIALLILSSSLQAAVTCSGSTTITCTGPARELITTYRISSDWDGSTANTVYRYALGSGSYSIPCGGSATPKRATIMQSWAQQNAHSVHVSLLNAIAANQTVTMTMANDASCTIRTVEVSSVTAPSTAY